MILPADATELTVTPTAANKQFQVHIWANGTEYGRKDAIPVKKVTLFL